jgi:hypothetical protein
MGLISKLLNATEILQIIENECFLLLYMIRQSISIYKDSNDNIQVNVNVKHKNLKETSQVYINWKSKKRHLQSMVENVVNSPISPRRALA